MILFCLAGCWASQGVDDPEREDEDEPRKLTQSKTLVFFFFLLQPRTTHKNRRRKNTKYFCQCSRCSNHGRTDGSTDSVTAVAPQQQQQRQLFSFLRRLHLSGGGGTTLSAIKRRTREEGDRCASWDGCYQRSKRFFLTFFQLFVSFLFV